MSEKTHADIIAEMRYKAGVICPWQVNGGTCELCPLGHSPHGKDLWKYCSFHKLAHELDAAHKREVGDCAKLREAVCEILSYIESFHKYITPGKGKKLTALFAVADTIRNNARAALAAPPRNCDRFANAVEAMAELKRVHSYCAKENRRCLEDCPDCGKEWCSLAWLFAPATESEAQA